VCGKIVFIFGKDRNTLFARYDATGMLPGCISKIMSEASRMTAHRGPEGCPPFERAFLKAK
jgi:hypothetical protein